MSFATLLITRHATECKMLKDGALKKDISAIYVILYARNVVP